MVAIPENLQQDTDDKEIVSKALELGVPPPANTISQWHNWLKRHGSLSNKTRGNAVLWEFEFNIGKEYPSQKVYIYNEKDKDANADVNRKGIRNLYTYQKNY